MITIMTLKDMLVDLKGKTSKDIHDELMPFILPIKDMDKELFDAPLSTVPFGDGDTYKLIRFLSKNMQIMNGCVQFALIAPATATNPETGEKKKMFMLFVVERFNKVWHGAWDYETGEYLHEPEIITEGSYDGDLMVAIKLFAYQLACSVGAESKAEFYNQSVKIVQETMDILIARHGGE